MPQPVRSEEDLVAELEQIAPLPDRTWRDTVHDPEAAALIADWRALGALSWVHVPTTIERVGEILDALVAIANPVTAIAGGVTGVAQMMQALRGH